MSGRRESNSRCMTPSHAYYHYTTARLGTRNCFFGLGLDAVGADFEAIASHAGPLEVGVALGFNGGIIMTAQKDARGGHRWFLTTLRASSHSDCYITLKLLS